MTDHAKSPSPVADEEHGLHDLARFLPDGVLGHEWTDEVVIAFYPDGSFQGAHAIRYRIARSPFEAGEIEVRRDMVEVSAEDLGKLLPDRGALVAELAQLDKERDRLGAELATAENALVDTRQELAEAQAYIRQIETTNDGLKQQAEDLQRQADQAMASRMPTGA